MTPIDPETFETLFRQHWHAQLGTIRRDWRSVPAEDAADLLQTAWLEAWRTWDCDIDNRGTFVLWVWRNIRQQLFRRIQNKKARVNSELIPIASREDVLDSGVMAAYDVDSVDGAAVIEIRDLVARLYAIVRQRDTSRDCRALPWEPVITCLIRGMRYSEIAAATGMASDRSVCILILQMRRYLSSVMTTDFSTINNTSQAMT
ncbi:MAG: hypothetical protein RRC34_02945 [Lentisphaeria bacterium]|nr:hypothetical protein [Lentisphaeria bacterium]